MVVKFLKSLFSGSGTAEPAAAAEPVVYDSFMIFVEPRPAGSQWQVAGRIEKTIDGATRSHLFIRADTMSSRDEAGEHTLRKAKLLIDQQGDALFG